MKFYIVVFDDEQGLSVPYGFDEGCKGAICATSGDVALFATRKEAQQAIRISTKYAELCKAQGIPENTDFLGESRKCIKIRCAKTEQPK
jgi:hypothetical protein